MFQKRDVRILKGLSLLGAVAGTGCGLAYHLDQHTKGVPVYKPADAFVVGFLAFFVITFVGFTVYQIQVENRKTKKRVDAMKQPKERSLMGLLTDEVLAIWSRWIRTFVIEPSRHRRMLKAKELYDAGIYTEEEFQAKIAELKR